MFPRFFAQLSLKTSLFYGKRLVVRFLFVILQYYYNNVKI